MAHQSSLVQELDQDDYDYLRWRNRDKFEYYRQGKEWDRIEREIFMFGGPHKQFFPKGEEERERCKTTVILSSIRNADRSRGRLGLIDLVVSLT